MIDEKWFALSRTIWGMILMAAPVILPMVGFDWTPEKAAALEEAATQWETLLVAGSGFIGAILVVVGRQGAKSKLTILPKKSA